jgi:hypothetical protein
VPSFLCLSLDLWNRMPCVGEVRLLTEIMTGKSMDCGDCNTLDFSCPPCVLLRFKRHWFTSTNPKPSPLAYHLVVITKNIRVN